MTTLRIHLLGSLRVDLDGQPVADLRTDKVRGLLAFLAVEGEQPQRRETLAGMLWPEQREQRARANLSQALYMLRRAIGDDVAAVPFLTVRRDAIRLNPDATLWLDVDAFTEGVRAHRHANTPPTIRQLETAVALYQGEFLAGFSLDGSAAFELWCLSVRERLRRLLGDALAQLTAFYEGACDYETALRHARRLVALDSWREEAHVTVMRLLALCDRRSEALAQYEACRRGLAENLGIAPMPQTTELYEAIRAGQFGVETMPDATLLEMGPAAPSFLATAPPPPPPPLCVARERQLAWLEGALASVLEEGDGRAVFVAGEAGSGKTVLCQTFARQAMARHPDLLVASGKGTAYTGHGDPYAAFREITSQLTGNVATRVAAGTVSQEQAARLWRALPIVAQALVQSAPDLIGAFADGERLLARAAAFAREAQPTQRQGRWVAQLQRLVTRRSGGHGLAGQQQHALFAQFSRFLADVARPAPLLLFLDDLQWADAGTIGMLFHLVRNLAGQRILVLGAYRPEEIALTPDGKRHPLAPVVHEAQRDFGEVVLNLGEAPDAALVEALVDSEPNDLGAAFRERLFRLTGGHPLFTAELLRGLQERGDLRRDAAGRWVAGASLDWDTLPPRVEGVIAERIARLPLPSQRLLRAASVQGESFIGEVAARALRVDEGEALSALSGDLRRDHRLVQAQSLERAGDGHAPSSVYQFHHFLFQKYLYDSLDAVERAHLHERTGATMASRFGDRPSAMAVQMARHFELAGAPDRAVHYCLQAGYYAIAMSAHDEAIDHFSRGLALLTTLPAAPARTDQELALQLGLGTCLQLKDGYGSAGAQRAYSRARGLCRQVGESTELVAALWPLATYAAMVGDIPQGVQLAEQALRVARRVEDPFFIGVAHHHLGWILYEAGRFAESVEHQEAMIASYDRQYHGEMVRRFGHDFGVTSLGWIAWPLCYLGYPDQALQRGHEAIALAQSFDHPFSLMHAFNMTALVHSFRGESQQAAELGERVMALATTYGFANYVTAANYILGGGLIARGQFAAGLARWREALVQFEEAGVILFHRGNLLAFARVYAAIGDSEAGLQALAEADAIGAGDYTDGLIEHARGTLLDLQGCPPEEVEACFQRAIQIARRQQARFAELQATMSLCRLWQRQGRGEEAREKLAGVYNWFTEGFETADLRGAAALLAELA